MFSSQHQHLSLNRHLRQSRVNLPIHMTPTPFLSIPKPTADEYNPQYNRYIQQTPFDNLLPGMVESMQQTMALCQIIPEEKRLFQYAPGKWTIQEVVQHIIDAERIFAYRALRFARMDKTPLASFDEDAYAAVSMANSRPWDDLVNEYQTVRNSTICLFRSFSSEMLAAKGSTDTYPMTVRALGYIMLGHEYHHIQILKERYL